MTKPRQDMDTGKFEDLVSAYGADPRRWPEESRSSAKEFARTPEGKGIVARAARFDAVLDRYEDPAISRALQIQVLASARRTINKQRWIHRCVLGATMAGLTLAGGLSGAAAVMTLLPPSALISSEPATAFGNLQSDDPRDTP